MLEWVKSRWPWVLIGLTAFGILGAMLWKRGQQATNDAGSTGTGATDPSTAALQVAQTQALQTEAALSAAAVLSGLSASYNGTNAAALGTSQTTNAQNDLAATLGLSGTSGTSTSTASAPPVVTSTNIDAATETDTGPVRRVTPPDYVRQSPTRSRVN